MSMAKNPGGMAQRAVVTEEGEAGRLPDGRDVDDVPAGLRSAADRWDAQELVCWTQWASIGGTGEVSALGMTTEGVVRSALPGPYSAESLLTCCPQVCLRSEGARSSGFTAQAGCKVWAGQNGPTGGPWTRPMPQPREG